jgi:hypothetical protein
MFRRLLLSALLAVVAFSAMSAAAQAAPPRLGGSLTVVPNELDGASPYQWYFDDHSIAGDDHMAWTDGVHPTQSQPESRAIRFGAAIGNAGPGALALCGYRDAGGWMRAYQVDGGCPQPAPTSGQVGWFRYIYGYHGGTWNRWHMMDLERFALVPFPGQAGLPTVWDNHWGTCGDQACEPAAGAQSTSYGIPATGVSNTQLADQATQLPDTTLIPIRPGTIPQGTWSYQVVSLTNPYGLISEAAGPGSVRCVNVTVRVGPYGDIETTLIHPSPGTCYVPNTLDPAASPSNDPMAGAGTQPLCGPLLDGSHCWAEPPVSGDHPLARTIATGNPSVIPSTEVAQGAAIPAHIIGSGRPPGLAPAVISTTPAATPAPVNSAQSAIAARRRLAVTRTRSALRKVFGRGLTRVRATCRLRTRTASTCTVSFRKRGARYSGKVYLRAKTVHRRLRWQYRVDVTRRKSGKTTHIRRGYRTGGVF